MGVLVSSLCVWCKLSCAVDLNKITSPRLSSFTLNISKQAIEFEEYYPTRKYKPPKLLFMCMLKHMDLKNLNIFQ